MTARSRTVLDIVDCGLAHRQTSPSNILVHNEGPDTVGHHTCSDTVDGTHNDHTLSITHNRMLSVSPLNGMQGNLVSYRKFDKYIPGYYRDRTVSAGSTSYPPNLATTLRARSNPNRPSIDLPVAIAELREIPKLFKIAGETLLRKGSNAFLSYQYGWRPLINDMSALLDVGDHTARRVNELERLYSKGGLRRRVTLHEDTKKSSGTVTIFSSFSQIVACRYDITTKYKCWGTVRWFPTTMPPFKSEDERRRVARLLVLGLSGIVNKDFKQSGVIAAHGVWQLMPWSWMSDWFGNVGEFLQGSLNAIPCQPTGVCIMKHVDTVASYSRTSDTSGWATGGDCVLQTETKSREVPAGATLAASFPFLSGTKLAVLGALGIQRIPRRLLR